jgi:hypothetical protein
MNFWKVLSTTQESKMKKLFLFILPFLFSCSSVQINGETRLRLETVGSIKKNCMELVGKEVVLEATYRGWDCPSDCGAPPVTRSDVCLEDSTGCIYSTPFLSPINDRGKLVRLLAKVKKKGNECYLEPVRIYEVR